MFQTLLNKLFLNLAIVLVICNPVYSQNLDGFTKCDCSNNDKQMSLEALSTKLVEQQDFINSCNLKLQKQLEKNGNKVVKIAGNCEWSNNGCPVNLRKPIFSRNAKIFNAKGIVKIEIIINPDGKVILSKPSSGLKLLLESASKAACESKFFPLIYCGTKVYQRRIISYNFR